MNPISNGSKGRVIVTCGPAYAPIDEVRRITNHSTGQLGSQLSNHFARAGWDVLCFRGVGATHCEPFEPNVRCVPFSTNDDLLARWQAVEGKDAIRAVFHAAALTDFTVKHVSDASGTRIADSKIPSRAGELTITLEPSRKLICELRGLFPSARLVGWKYELNGTQDDVLAKGSLQILENHTDACVVNGRAYGTGFGILQTGQPLVHVTEAAGLCDWLAHWLERE